MTGRMNLLTSKLKQTAVLWANPVKDGQGGATFDEPIEVNVRWEQKQEMFADVSGQERRSDAVVFVGRDVVVGGYLFLGNLDDLSSAEEGDPLIVGGAYEIRKFEKIPDLSASRYVRKVWL